MDRVWIVVADWDESDQIVGVFSSKERADQWIEAQRLAAREAAPAVLRDRASGGGYTYVQPEIDNNLEWYVDMYVHERTAILDVHEWQIDTPDDGWY